MTAKPSRADPDDALTKAEASALEEAVGSFAALERERIIAARTLEPRLVPHTAEAIDVDDPDSPNGKAERPGRRDTITECPDCGRGLQSIALAGVIVRACPRLVVAPAWEVAGEPTADDVIACGGKRGD